MNFFVLCLLCIIQGITEFLPISSSGHLLLFEQLFNINGNILGLNLFLHLATLVAVVIVYRQIIWNLIKKPFQPLTYKLLLSTGLTLIFAFAYKFLNIDSFVTSFYGFCFLATALILLLCHKFKQKSATVSPAEISYKSACVVGIAQGFAVLPGLSRSGTTIASLLFCGNDDTQSAEYSFLLSIPIIIGGFVLELVSTESLSLAFCGLSLLECGFAFGLTFLVSIFSLKLTIKMLKNNKFIYSSIYLFIVGLFVVIYNFIF